ncbi:MAG: YihY/virulence factor BrkB family protein [Actinobacteria bacterium]|nr:MAG: YihY/virulence factor BrkB family protein [Actinomycetota bacterium]
MPGSLVGGMSDRKKSRAKVAFEVLKDAAKQHGRHFGSRMAAAIAYRTVFAIAPLLVIAVSIAGFVLGGDAAAQEALITNVQEVAGDEMASLAEDILMTALESADTAAVVGVLVLIWTASALFIEVQRDLNQIFHFPRPEEGGIMQTVIQRGLGVLWTLGFGLGLIALFAANTAAQAAGAALSDFLNMPEWVVGILSFFVTFAFVIVVFALIFQSLTRNSLPWRPVWIGAVFTSVAFSAAGYLLGVYFRLFDEPSALGFTGTLVVLLFVAFLLSTVFLFGAQVTQSYRELVWDKEDAYVFTDDQGRHLQRDADERRVTVSLTAVGTFLVGLLIGLRRK